MTDRRKHRETVSVIWGNEKKDMLRRNVTPGINDSKKVGDYLQTSNNKQSYITLLVFFYFLFSLHIFLLSNYICRHRQEFSIISPCLFFSDTFPNHRTMAEKNDNIYMIYNTYNNIFISPL